MRAILGLFLAVVVSLAFTGTAGATGNHSGDHDATTTTRAPQATTTRAPQATTTRAPQATTTRAPQATTTQTTGGAGATDNECDVADFSEDGVLDTTSYLACVAGATQTNDGSTAVAGTIQTGGASALPATGSDAGRYLVFAAVLLVLGGAAVAGSLQTRRMAATD